MEFMVDSKSGVPFYRQIIEQVKFAISRGDLKSGDQLPTMRQLAVDLAINPNTVARAYRELQSDGVLETVRGTGLAVAPGADKRCRTDRVKLIRQRLRQVLVEAWQSRLDAGQLRSLVEE